MFIFSQSENYIVGDINYISKLAENDNARILVISDSHGDYKTLSLIIQRYGKTCDALIFCGDGIVDLISLFEESVYNNQLKECIPSVVAFVNGNCDSFGGYGSVQSIPVDAGKSILQLRIPNSQELKVGNHKIYICHGHLDGVSFGYDKLEQKCKTLNCDLSFYGHTHIALQYRKDNLLCVNPGSCSRPRGGQKPGFAIATVQSNLVDIAFIQIVNPGSAELDFKIYTPIM